MGYILAAMGAREFQSNRELIKSIVERVQRDLESNSIVVLHGSLLALREFFLYAEKVNLFLATICNHLFRRHGIGFPPGSLSRNVRGCLALSSPRRCLCEKRSDEYDPDTRSL